MALIEFEGEPPVAVIRLNRPPVNALSTPLLEELAAALETAAGGGFRALIITGEPHFAAGADIREFMAALDGTGPAGSARLLGRVVRRLEELPLPTIAAVRGYALGGGLELAMGADFRYLADDATVGQPEISLGLIPGAGGTQRLPRLVGPARAREIIFTGRNVAATEALALGLADRVVPAAGLMETALEDAGRLAAGPTAALAAAKRAMRAGADRGLDAGLESEVAEFEALFETDDAREGVTAFLEKRRAEFTGG